MVKEVRKKSFAAKYGKIEERLMSNSSELKELKIGAVAQIRNQHDSGTMH